MIRSTGLAMIAALAFAVAPTGCATVIGLDNGHPVSDEGGDPDGASDDAEPSVTDAGGRTCAPNNQTCGNDRDCCSGKCDNQKCSKPGG